MPQKNISTAFIWQEFRPPEFTINKMISDFEEDNKICQYVFDRLLLAEHNCFEVTDRYSSIISIFFYKILFILNAYILIKREIDRKEVPNFFLKNNVPNSIFYNITYFDAYSGKADLLQRDSLEHRKQDTQKKLIRKELFIQLLGHFTGYKGKTIAIQSPSGGLTNLTKYLLINGYKIVYPKEYKIEIANFDKQFHILENCISEVETFSKTPYPEWFKNGLKYYLKRFQSAHNTKVPWDILICGSLSNPQNKITAARTMKAGKPVIAISHGDCDEPAKDPGRTYSEISMCTHYLQFGTGNNYSQPPNNNKLPEIIPSNSKIIRQIYKNQNIKKLSEIKNPKYMYICNALSYTNRSGPFRDISDCKLIQWTRYIVQNLPIKYIKRHPKGSSIYRQETISDIDFYNLLIAETSSFKKNPEIISGNLKDCLEIPDVFILDIVTTAFALAAATDKPIIYLDFGLRQPLDSTIEDIKNRCIYIDVRKIGPDNLLFEIQKQAEKKCVNTFTEKYSLMKTSTETREATLISTLKKTI